MAQTDIIIPDTLTLCDCVEPTEADAGRAFSAPLAPSNEMPTQAISADATLTYVDSEPTYS